jgi:hypothetical protein
MRKEEKVDRKLIDIGEQTEGERANLRVWQVWSFSPFLKQKKLT